VSPTETPPLFVFLKKYFRICIKASLLAENMTVTTDSLWYRHKNKGDFIMWEKFKESNFAKKCKELSHKGGFVATVVCLSLIVAIVLSVSIATNRAKKKYAPETDETGGSATEEATTDNHSDVGDGTLEVPGYNDESEKPTGADTEVFELALPVDKGYIAKSHDASIQVWSETYGAYKVHLGVDVATDVGAKVYAAEDGKIEKIWDDALMGRCISIDHGDGIYTFYMNLTAEDLEGISEGASVTCGAQIGTVGESAIAELADEPHLHVEMTLNGVSVDPAEYFSDEALATLAENDSFEAGVNEEDTIS
jgi:murein DD-endopeptidase MepM/ murein hydrolase activator NlpD